MASPQVENGFTRIANEILEALAKTDLNGTQRRILDIVFRQTYGFQRKEHEISLTFLSDATELHKMQIQRELADLINRNILIVVKDASFNKSRTIAFNKVYSQWNSKRLAKKLTGSESNNHTVSEKANHTVSELANQIKKKEIYKETYSDFVKILLSEYPGKKIKATRDKKLPDILKKYSEEEILRCVKRYADEVRGKDQRYILNESTFWNGRYMDYLDENYNEPVIGEYQGPIGVPPSESILGEREEPW